MIDNSPPGSWRSALNPQGEACKVCGQDVCEHSDEEYTGVSDMYAPDVWETTEDEKAYRELRWRADALGFACVGEALDKLEELIGETPR